MSTEPPTGRALDAREATESILAEVAAVATPERAEHEKAYLKSDLEFLGASVPDIRRTATRFARGHPGLSHDELCRLVDELWRQRIHELRMVTVELLKLYLDRLTPEDAVLLERLVREARTWALVDGLAGSVSGPLLETHPAEMDVIVRRWADDDSFWVRRASLLAHLSGLRRGEGDFDRFAALADGMLDEQEFFIRKAIGWVLREAGKQRPRDVTAWLEPRLGRASPVTVREAVKYLPEADRQRLVEAHRKQRRGTRRGS